MRFPFGIHLVLILTFASAFTWLLWHQRTHPAEEDIRVACARKNLYVLSTRAGFSTVCRTFESAQSTAAKLEVWALQCYPYTCPYQAIYEAIEDKVDMHNMMRLPPELVALREKHDHYFPFVVWRPLTVNQGAIFHGIY